MSMFLFMHMANRQNKENKIKGSNYFSWKANPFDENNFVYSESAWGDGIYNPKAFDNATVEQQLQALESIKKVANCMKEAEKFAKNVQPKNERKIITKLKPRCYRLLQITEFLYSSKSQKEIFEPMVAEWEFEYFEAIKESELSKARWINFRFLYSYIFAIFLKNPITDFVEFIKKIAK